jgi:hypothetical protein
MSDAPPSLQQITAALAAHVPADPVALSMLPLESREFMEKASEYVTFLVNELKEARRESDNLHRALDMYAKNSGDTLFGQNLSLCLQQVTAP